MKKSISLILLLAVAALCNAQRKTGPALKETPVPQKNISKLLPKLADIIVSSLSITKEGSQYYANYTFKNIGNAPVKKGWLYAQGYINNTSQPCGGSSTTVLIPEKDESLNPGESINGKLIINPTGLTIGSTYTYILSAMNAKKNNEGTPYEEWVCENYNFQESNIENNLKTATFILQL